MSITSLFVFNKVKNELKKRNIIMKSFLYVNFEKKQVVIDDDKYEIENQFFDLYETQFKDLKDLQEALITQSKVILKQNEKKIIL